MNFLSCATQFATAKALLSTCKLQTNVTLEEVCYCQKVYNNTAAGIIADTNSSCATDFVASDFVSGKSFSGYCSTVVASNPQAVTAEQPSEQPSITETAEDLWKKHGGVAQTIGVGIAAALIVLCVLRLLYRLLQRAGVCNHCRECLRSAGVWARSTYEGAVDDLHGFVAWCTDACSGATEDDHYPGTLPGGGRSGRGRDPERVPLRSAQGELPAGAADFYQRESPKRGQQAGLAALDVVREDLKHLEDETGQPAYWQPPYYDAQINSASGHHTVMSHPGAVGRTPAASAPPAPSAPLAPLAQQQSLARAGLPAPGALTPAAGAPFTAPPTAQQQQAAAQAAVRARMPFPGGLI